MSTTECRLREPAPEWARYGCWECSLRTSGYFRARLRLSPENAEMALTWGFWVERPRGIEPPPSVWKTEALPLSYGRAAARIECGGP